MTDRTKQVQKWMKRIEKNIGKLKAASECENECKAHGITQEAMDQMKPFIDNLDNAARELHTAMNVAADSSTLDSVVALGPGPKGDD